MTTAIIATPGSVIDAGARQLQITGSGSITVQSGSLTLRGRTFAAGPQTLIRTSGPTRADAAASLSIEADEVLLAGQIDTRGSPAGDVDVVAATALSFSGTLRGRSEAADASASVVTLAGDILLIAGSIDLDGGRDDTGGDVSISGRRVTLAGSIVVNGGDGGSVDVSAAELLEVTAAASVSANATTPAGDGGDISLDSDEVLEIRGDLAANGRSGAEEGGGDGGQIALNGDSAVVVSDISSHIESLGGGPDGLGGDIDVTSLFGSAELQGTMWVNSTEIDGAGGGVDVSTDTSITIGGALRARGGLGGGGDIELDAGTFVSVAQAALLDASAIRDGQSGTIAVLAGSFVDVRGMLLADTTSNNTAGGSITIDACAISTIASAVVRSRGMRASNLLVAAGAMTLRGTLSADVALGSNTLRYPDEGPVPNTTGASISPAAVLDPRADVIPCDPLPPTPTPSFTPTPSPSPTPTATIMPPDCAGDCDGNGVVTIAELIRAVNIALGQTDVANCRAADENGDGRVTIGELIRAVGSALDGCG